MGLFSDPRSGAILLGTSTAALYLSLASPAACFAPVLSRGARPPALPLSMSDMNSMSKYNPSGSSARPLDRKRIAICGAGGYLGSTIFGYLQRASSLYGTGISPKNSPRAVLSSAYASVSLNGVLSKSFKLAYAGENLMALTDLMDEDAIAKRLAGFDALVLGTRCATERRPGNYDTRSLNAKTYEFLLDGPRGADADPAFVPGGGPTPDGEDPARFHLDSFRRQVRAAAASGSVRHVFVVGTPATTGSEAEYAAVLDAEASGGGINFTFLRTGGAELVSCRDYTFERGVLADPGALGVRSSTLTEGYRRMAGYEDGDWMGLLLAAEEMEGDDDDDDDNGVGAVAREDLAALVVQSILSLDWSKSRVLELRCAPGGLPDAVQRGVRAYDPGVKKPRMTKPVRTDREWCVKSSVLAEKLMGIE